MLLFFKLRVGFLENFRTLTFHKLCICIFLREGIITQFFVKLLQTIDSNIQNPLFNTMFQNCKILQFWNMVLKRGFWIFESMVCKSFTKNCVIIPSRKNIQMHSLWNVRVRKFSKKPTLNLKNKSNKKANGFKSMCF